MPNETPFFGHAPDHLGEPVKLKIKNPACGTQICGVCVCMCLSLTEVVKVVHVLLACVVCIHGRAGGQGHVVQRLHRHLLLGEGLRSRPLCSSEFNFLFTLFRLAIDLIDCLLQHVKTASLTVISTRTNLIGCFPVASPPSCSCLLAGLLWTRLLGSLVGVGAAC